ncbi:uncharacterized protein V6R79_025243 [Siganus canaliculatus]
MYRSTSLEQKELMALFGEEQHGYFRDEEYDPDSESIEDGKSCRSVRSSLSLEIYGLQREQHVYFSNQEYYRRLEELKRAHLRNMAELERMYISQGREWRGEDDDGGRADIGLSLSSGPDRRLQRINSQEELDFHDTSSGSDQSELTGADSLGELEYTCTNGTGRDRMFGRDFLLSPEEMTTQKHFRFQPKASPPKSSRQPGSGIRPNSKVTVPKPFQMMLREEERKRHRVRTRSEIELENTLLRRELEELQECQKKFRATPAPAHIHLPLYEVISRRSSQRSSRSRSSRSSSSSDDSGQDFKRSQASASSSPQPFHFLERERRKREAKIAAELGMRDPKEEQRSFRARPMPRSVYGPRRGAGTRSSSLKPQFEAICTLEREATEGQSEPNSDLEQEVLTTRSDSCSSDSCKTPRWSSSAKPVKKQIQLSIELVKESEPPKNLRSLHPGGPEPRVCCKSHCISV